MARKKKIRGKLIWILLCSIVLVFTSMANLDNYRRCSVTLEELERYVFTVEMVEKTSYAEGRPTYEIWVEGEKKPLRVSSFVNNRAVQSKIERLSVGDVIYCYLIEVGAEREVVQFGSADDVIVSLTEYRNEFKRSEMFSLVALPMAGTLAILIILFCLMRIKRALKYNKRNRKKELELQEPEIKIIEYTDDE